MGQIEKEEEAHRAIGRYVVEFSHLIFEMRAGIEYRLEGDDPLVIKLALGEAYASQITNAFFAICEHQMDLDDEEKQVAIRLKKEVNDAIKDRNDFAHGDWHMGSGEFDDPRLHRTKPGRKDGAWVETVMPVDELDALSDQLGVLASEVIEFAWLCLGIHPLTRFRGMDVRVRDIFRFQKRQVLRKGRYADERWFEDDD